MLKNYNQAQVWNWRTLRAFKDKVHKTLIHKHNIIGTLRQIEGEENERGEVPVYKVFLAKKHYTWTDAEGSKRDETVTYAIQPNIVQYMPIRPNMKKCEEVVENKNIIYRIQPKEGFVGFKIVPKKAMTFRQLVDLPGFEHTNPDDYFLFKLISITTYTHRIFAGVSTNSHFGKDSHITILNELTDEMPIAEMGSTAAMLRDLNPTGCMVFNETNSLTTEMKRIAENLIMKSAAGQTSFKNEKKGSAAHHTKDEYDIKDMSLLFMYNDIEQYSKPENFFDNLWKNPTAVKDRILRFKLSGKLTTRFSRNFSYSEALNVAEPLFIDTLKTLSFYRENKDEDFHSYTWPVPKNEIKLSNRQLDTFEAIVHNLDRASNDVKEFRKYFLVLLDRIKAYDEMINTDELIVTEEVIKDDGGD